MVCFIEIQSESMKMTWSISLYIYFSLFIVYNFSNVMALQFCE